MPLPAAAYYAGAAIAAMVIWAYTRKDDDLAELPSGEDDWWDEDDLIMEDDPEPFEPGIGGQGTATTIPNISGRSAGYNDLVWSSPLDVQKVLYAFGYQSSDPVNTAPAPSAVRAFQKHYNTASELAFQDAVGQLEVDGKAGKNTLNAMERVAFGFDGPNPQDYARWAAWKTEFGLW
jgi:hypothetical protein